MTCELIATSTRRLYFHLWLSVCLSVCLSVNRISQNILDQFSCTFVERVGHRPYKDQLIKFWLKLDEKFIKSVCKLLSVAEINEKTYLIALIIPILCKSLIFINKLNYQKTMDLTVPLFIE